MYEIEIKAYCDDLKNLEELLNEKGAQFIKEIEQHDIYFNHPDRDFALTDEAFRIRSFEGKQKITYKGPKLSKETKTREELETEVEDFFVMEKILQKLGFRESGSVKKVRRKYLMDGVTICLDSVDRLGTFVEFEKIGKDIKIIEAELFKLAEDFNIHTFERKSYLSLLLEKQ